MPRPLRIAQVAPILYPVPPTLYGGTERMISYLTEALVEAGQEVTLFASGDSVTTARLVSVRPTCLAAQGSPDPLPVCIAHLAEVRRRMADFDILHLHDSGFSALGFQDRSARTVTTLHMSLEWPDTTAAFRAMPDMPLVSISECQRHPYPEGHWAGTIYHGIPADLYRFSPRPEGHLAFLGRLSATKQPHEAIRIAQATGHTLFLAGPPEHPQDPYFVQSVAPHLAGPGVRYLGELDDRRKDGLLGSAKALLFPIAWEEPFGLVMIEAMATGTPVIAYRRGAAPEVVEDGVTGFVVDSFEEAVAAVGRLDRLDRATIRRRFEERFSAKRMAADYIALYRSRLERAGLALAP
ncbi:glycosyltransferase family 4 protein [Aerophototrophica crusticola]|uniref:Glycosyltransferase family 4 protein n=1 Tax=Aerophototrophica crusticola TaxID=1709002 RepID=A0A858R535_9PROT|nr:glycosyltransferase family 4 protein [Rhodospirillaceae bacterium B3]